MEPIRILHVVHSLQRGGMESRIMDIYRHIDRDKYQYDFYIESGEKGVFDDEVINLKGCIFYREGDSRVNIPRFKMFHRFLESHPEYKIICAYNQWAGWYLKQASQCGVPYRIANARTSIATKSIKNTIKNIAKRNVNRYATHKFAVSHKAAIWLFGEESVKRHEVKIWPNAIDTRKYAFSNNTRVEVRRELGIKDELVIIHVGNLRFEKNHPFLIDVFNDILKIYPDAQLILAGRGNLDIIKKEIDKYSIRTRIHYLGERSDVDRLLQAGDFFIFPSLYEGFPGAVLEAECSGFKCIISDSITDEVMVTDHIIALPFSVGSSEWAKTIDMFGDVNRETAWVVVKNAGYDIQSLTDRLQVFYDSIIKSVQ